MQLQKTFVVGTYFITSSYSRMILKINIYRLNKIITARHMIVIGFDD